MKATITHTNDMSFIIFFDELLNIKVSYECNGQILTVGIFVAANNFISAIKSTSKKNSKDERE
jgi:hypothetical protein